MKINTIKASMALLLSLQSSVFAASSYTLVETAAQFEEIDRTSKPAVVMFSAPWCGPCKQMEPFFDQAAGENPEVSFFKVDTSKASLEKITNDYNVQGLPTTVFVYKGEEVSRATGGLRKQDLAQELTSFLQKIKTPSKPAVVKPIEKEAVIIQPAPAPITPAAKPAPVVTEPVKPVCKKSVILPEESWNKIKEILEGLNKPEYKELINSATNL